jgi:probable HAF family extracellular repeat protein
MQVLVSIPSFWNMVILVWCLTEDVFIIAAPGGRYLITASATSVSFSCSRETPPGEGKMHRRRWSLSAQITGSIPFFASALFLFRDARAGVEYTLTPLGTLPGSVYSYANAINDSGEIVGYSYVSGGPAYFGVNPYDVPGTWHAFVYSNGQMTDLGTFGGEDSMASGINNNGQIVGTILTSTGTAGFLYTNGVETNIGSLGGTNTYAQAINNAGQITGDSYTGGKDVDSDPIFHAFVYSGGTMTDLGTAAGYQDAQGNSINSSGEIAGSLYNPSTGNSAFLYSSGQLSNIGPSDDNMEVATGINDAGQIIGYESSGEGLLDSNGVITALGSNTTPLAINNHGEIVGYTYNVNLDYTAIVDINGVKSNLNTLISPTSDWDLQQATDVNSLGDIVGFGLNPSGNQQAFLLTPIPEPGTLSLAALGATALSCRLRSNRSRESPL